MTMTSSSFPPLRPLALTLAAALVMTACGGGGDAGPAGTEGPAGGAGLVPLTRVLAEPAGTHCAQGGSRIDAGLDLDANRTLDTAEVTSTQYVCHGAAGATATSLVRVAAEAAGSHCPFGGSRIDAGIDGNANGVLDAAEVSATGYVCQASTGGTGTPGGSGPTGSSGISMLTAVTPEAAGANCTQGGQRVTLGADTNGNGALDTAEVTSTRYLCNGAPAAELTWQAITSNTATASGGNYLVTGNTTLTLTLPASPRQGETVRVSGLGSGGWRIAQNSGQTILGAGLPVTYASVLPFGARRKTSVGWEAAAASYDGRRLVTMTASEIHTSSDAGVTWTLRLVVLGGNLRDVASSHDGQRLVAVESNGYVYVSPDAGLNWTAHDTPRNWKAVASSADGRSMIAAALNEPLRRSVDGGQTWSALAGSPSAAWSGVTSSADGQKLTATVNGGQIQRSNDGGSTWTAIGDTDDWSCIASSSDGNVLVAAGLYGLTVSVDAGSTWGPGVYMPGTYRVAVSGNGRKIMGVAPGNGFAYTSTSVGPGWTRDMRSSGDLRALAFSGDGNTLVMGDYTGSGGLYALTQDRSTPGFQGSLAGGQYDTIELQYIGLGQFVARSFSSHNGSFTMQ